MGEDCYHHSVIDFVLVYRDLVTGAKIQLWLAPTLYFRMSPYNDMDGKSLSNYAAVNYGK